MKTSSRKVADLSRWTKGTRRMTKKELEEIKRAYHIGDNRYAPNLCVERMVAEIEALWRDRERRRLKRIYEEDYAR